MTVALMRLTVGGGTRREVYHYCSIDVPSAQCEGIYSVSKMMYIPSTPMIRRLTCLDYSDNYIKFTSQIQ